MRLAISDPSHLVRIVHGGEWDRARLASLAPDVIRAATREHPAAKLVDDQAGELAGCIAAGVAAVALPPKAVPIALAGGLLVHADYRDRLLRQLRYLGVRPSHVLAVSEPAEAPAAPGVRGGRHKVSRPGGYGSVEP